MASRGDSNSWLGASTAATAVIGSKGCGCRSSLPGRCLNGWQVHDVAAGPTRRQRPSSESGRSGHDQRGKPERRRCNDADQGDELLGLSGMWPPCSLVDSGVRVACRTLGGMQQQDRGLLRPRDQAGGRSDSWLGPQRVGFPLASCPPVLAPGSGPSARMFGRARPALGRGPGTLVGRAGFGLSAQEEPREGTSDAAARFPQGSGLGTAGLV